MEADFSAPRLSGAAVGTFAPVFLPAVGAAAAINGYRHVRPAAIPLATIALSAILAGATFVGFVGFRLLLVLVCHVVSIGNCG